MTFIINAILLGVGLAMDAFSVSMANGLHEVKMKAKKVLSIAFTFGFFQFLMPMIGWICVHTIVEVFQQFEKIIPWIALLLLCYIGINLLKEGFSNEEEKEEENLVDFKSLLIQGVATSIDALSVGFTIANYNFMNAFICSLIIGIVTFIISFVGVHIGKKTGMKLAGKASILGGIILIGIGIEIFVTGVF
ncbi:MAG: manganese efflux pump [Erysipelotrichaceae bacterium]|uniref:manganese efflux pump MntP n=1 Tax=Floccifex sp. TaxID=2815810 RepID=UPI002A75AEF1|nr:manganese efflux pump [Floccifex sp.]MDD7281416.1 manganese efflux pump [Erysipelotrichaceae bacterium]MDY2959118.1 manganese efflux pump [Floccifex sp.]